MAEAAKEVSINWKPLAEHFDKSISGAADDICSKLRQYWLQEGGDNSAAVYFSQSLSGELDKAVNSPRCFVISRRGGFRK